MSACVKKERNFALESEEAEEEDGYVKIRYQQPDLPALEIPTNDNGDLPWKFVQALDPKIIGLAIQSKESRKILKIKNGVIQEPKKGWKSFKVIAFLEEPNENIVAIHSTASSCRDVSGVLTNEVKIKKENLPLQDFAYSTNVSAKFSSPTSLLPELEPINCASISLNSSSVHSTVDDNVNAAAHKPLIDEDASDNENSNSETSSLVHYPSTIANRRPTLDELFAAHKVKSFYELKNLVKKEYNLSATFFDILCCYLRKALIVHADKNIFFFLNYAEKSSILYNQLDQTASDFCELCQKPLTLGHLLKKEHLEEYKLKFHQEIPEIDIILHYFYSNYCDIKEKLRYVFATNTHSDKKLFDEYKDAFILRIYQQNLIIPPEDPYFLDRLLFMQDSLKRYSLPKSLKPNRGTCVICEKSYNSFHDFICHTLSINHIKNALSQEDLYSICEALPFIQNDKNGYKILLPPCKRKPNVDVTNEDTVPKKRSKRR